MSTAEAAHSDAATIAAAVGDLPTLAPVAMEVLRLADDDRASLEDIADVIGRDPALAAQLLRVANSPMYGMGGQTASLTRAAGVLGLRTVKLLSLSFSVVTRPEPDDRTAVLVWRHTLAASAMARAIASRRDPRVADECFVVALLSSLGRIALMEHPSYRAVLDHTGALAGPDEERAAVGCTSDEVTAALLRTWGLPEVLADAVHHRADPSTAAGVAARIANVLHVADAAARLIIAEPEPAGTALERYRQSASRHLDLTEEETDEMLVDAAPALEEIATMFRSDRPHDIPLDALLMRAKDSLARLSLDVIAALTQEQTRADQLASENQRLASEAATDPLTGLPNRRSYDEFLERTIAGRLRREVPGALGLLMLDLDRFKSVNDTHGHHVGDDVLRVMGARLALHTRRDEFAARIGGEEFVVVIPVTDRDEIGLAAERFRRAIADDPFETSIGPLAVTASVGAALLDDIGIHTAAPLFEAADAALYEAKEGGRNRVVVTTMD